MFNSRPQLQQYSSKISILLCSFYCESEKLVNRPQKIINLYSRPLISVSHLLLLLVSANNDSKLFKPNR